jgi:hypothetical protein
MSLEQQAVVAQCCRHLLARIIYQALKDEGLEGRPKRDWPWEDWHPRSELDTFWQGEWFASICDWLDIEPEGVLQLAAEARPNGR